MLLTITTTHQPATDLGYLLHKNPERSQTYNVSFGQAHVFYPERDPNRCTAALLVHVDPIRLVRGKDGAGSDSFGLQQYVNDRPYAASSFLSVAMNDVFRTAFTGRSKDRPDLADQAIPLEAHLAALPARGGEEMIRLHLDRMPERQRERISLVHGSLTYRDRRLEGHDAATVVEVVEHFDPGRLAAFERVLFEFAHPATVILTTPNVEYNVTWETLPADAYRHRDHRFEWTRREFRTWAMAVAERFGYVARFLPVGPEHAEYGPPTQMGVFSRV